MSNCYPRQPQGDRRFVLLCLCCINHAVLYQGGRSWEQFLRIHDESLWTSLLRVIWDCTCVWVCGWCLVFLACKSMSEVAKSASDIASAFIVASVRKMMAVALSAPPISSALWQRQKDQERWRNQRLNTASIWKDRRSYIFWLWRPAFATMFLWWADGSQSNPLSS